MCKMRDTLYVERVRRPSLHDVVECDSYVGQCWESTWILKGKDFNDLTHAIKDMNQHLSTALVDHGVCAGSEVFIFKYSFPQLSTTA